MNPLSKRFKRIFAFIKASSWEKAKQIVEAHYAELVDDTANMAFSFLLNTFEDDPNVVQVIQQHWQVIQHCQSNDIQAVFSDELLTRQKLSLPVDFNLSAKIDAQITGAKTLLGPYNEILFPTLQEALTKTLEQNPDLFLQILKQFGEQGLKQLIESPSQFNEMAQELLKQNPKLTNDLGNMLNEVVEQHSHLLPALEDKRETLIETLNNFITADSWRASQEFLEKHPELLTITVEQEIEHQIRRTRNMKHVSLLRQHRDLLRRGREIGVKQAFAELVYGTDALLMELRNDFEMVREARRNYLNTSDPDQLDDAIVLWEQILNNPAFPGVPEELRANFWIEACEMYAYRYYRTEGSPGDLDKMVALLQQAVAELSSTSPKLLTLLTNLADVLRERARLTEHLEDLDAAIICYRQTLAHFLPTDSDIPIQLYYLGISLHSRYTQTMDLKDLEQAIDCYQQLLKHFPQQSTNKSEILKELGASLSDRYALMSQLPDLEEAIDCYRRAFS